MATASWSSSTLVQSQISGFGGGLRQSRSHPNSLTFCKCDSWFMQFMQKLIAMENQPELAVSLLDGMANTGMVELGEVQLATYLFKKTCTGQPSFQNAKEVWESFLLAGLFGFGFVQRVRAMAVDMRNAVNRAKGQREGRAKTPALVPEDADPIWSVGSKTILSERSGMKQRIGSIMNGIHNCLGDPRIGLVLLLGALMSFGSIWL
ncbi:unnamed protein product [Camellia sinensis]